MKKFTQNKKLGFSLIELSVVILIIGILIIGVSKGSRLLNESKLKSAQSLTKSSPVNLMDDLVLWLDASSDENIATGAFNANPQDFDSDLFEGSEISSWRYSIPTKTSTFSVAAASDSNRPTYTENGINGLPAINFLGNGGSSQTLINSQSIFAAGQEKYSMIAVFSGNTINSGTSFIFTQYNSTCDGATAGIIAQGGEVGYYGCGVGKDLKSSATALSNNTNYLITITVDKTAATTTSIYLNSKTITLADNHGINTLGGGETRIAGSINSSSISLSELILFDDLLKASEIADVQDYLSKKYGINLN
jgi:prepilin-type N-terminal cleavage/methylation domain-containing protein